MTQPKEYLRSRELEGHMDVLDLEEEIRSLDEQVEQAGIAGKTLTKLPGLSVVLVRLKQGQDLDEHSVEGPALAQVLDGEVTLNAEGESERISAGSASVLSAGIPHDVHAEQDTTLLLTFNDGTQVD